MRILLVHNYYKSRNIGGEDIVFKEEMAALSDAIGQENVFEYSVSNDDIRKTRLLFTIWFSFYHLKKIKQIIKDNDIEIVHVHNFFPLLTPSIFIAAKKCGAKTIHTLHNYTKWCISGIFYRDDCGVCEECVDKNSIIPGIVNKCYRNSFLYSILVAAAFRFYRTMKFDKYVDKFFVLTNFQQRKVCGKLGIKEDRTVVKTNFVDNCSNGVERLGINNRDGYLFVGRLEREKGVDLLLDEWTKLSEEYVLTIIGNGSLKDRVVEYDKKYENIIYIGQVDRSDVGKYYGRAKFLIQPSLWYETFGLTVVEALSCGVPVIGFNIGTRSELVVDEKTGFLCDADDFLDTIRKASTYKKYIELVGNCFKSAEKYKKDVVLTKQVEIYRNILYECDGNRNTAQKR
jgi:glycosyltransferase involved in cell wall biosynthesis